MRNKRNIWLRLKRVKAMILAVMILLSMCLPSVIAHAEENPDGRCVHHPQHTQECGEDNASCKYATEGCPYCVAAWEWVDTQTSLTESDGGWVLSVPGAGEENSITTETIKNMLPTKIDATMGDGMPKTLDLIWDLTEILETGVVSGEYTLTASLGAIPQQNEDGDADTSAPDEAATSEEGDNTTGDVSTRSGDTAEPSDKYALANGADPLEITVKLGSEDTLSGDDGTDEDTTGTGETPFSQYVIEPEETYPSGTVINLFDYWLTNRDDADDDEPQNLREQGINKDHALLFFKNGQGGWNQWTGSAKPWTGIVQTTLGEDGYPALNKLNNQYDESLAYLFDPKTDNEGKQSFSNVGGLLQVDEYGYYYYNSQENYAWFNETTEEFVLYDTWGVPRRGTSPDGQFFPFVNPKTVFMENDNDLTQKTGVTSENEAMNHYFGLTMSTRFVQKNGGNTYGEQPVTYNFSGDDDVWIFIDGVLVADVGGIHDMCSVQIDFQTGRVVVYTDKDRDNLYDEGSDTLWKDTTLYAQFAAALGDDGLDPDDWNNTTFADDTYHTLKFFYLERGNYDSNMSLKFNLIPIPESEITKVDQLGDKLEGITFELYPAEKATDGTKSYTIKKDYENDPIWTGTTGKDGSLVIWDEDTNSPLVFQELAEIYDTNHFILREKEVPDGYRKVSDTYLEYIPATGLILSDHYWSTGSYAQPKITTTATTELYKMADSGKGDKIFDSTTAGDSTFPTIYAVVFKRLDMKEPVTDENNWAPVSGNAEDGWKVWDDPDVDLTERIKSAIEKNKQDEENQFELTTGGAFQVTLENLPGDITTYYWYLQQSQEPDEETKYTVNYYYEDPTGKLTRLYTDDFDRQFSTHLYIPNVKNYLLVQKVDETGNPITTPATFALYDANKVTVSDDGTITGNAYDTQTTGKLSKPDMEGGAIFGAEKDLVNGTYYLVETSAPDGYVKSDEIVKIIVDDTGVYADAGDKDDGVAVFRGVGSILKSMVQFAVDDHVDATLHDIKAVLQTGTETGNSIEWGTVDEESWNTALHLSYSANDKILEYGPSNPCDSVALRVDEGWGRLSILQCMEHHGQLNSPKTNLYTQDITSRFSGTCTVQVTNVKDGGSLTVSKKVTGTAGDTDKEWNFTVTLSDTTISGTYGGMFFNNGVATFKLKHNESKTATGLPAGLNYTVTEEGADRDGYTTTYTGGTGTIQIGQTATAAFTNEKNGTPNPGPTPDPDPEPDPDPDPDPNPGPDPDPNPDPDPDP